MGEGSEPSCSGFENAERNTRRQCLLSPLSMSRYATGMLQVYECNALWISACHRCRVPCCGASQSGPRGSVNLFPATHRFGRLRRAAALAGAVLLGGCAGTPPPAPAACSGWGTYAFFEKVTAAQVDACLAGGADAAAAVQDEQRNTPLHFFASLRPDEPRFVRVLLAAGAAPDARNYEGYTALHFAAQERGETSPEIATALLAAGADPNAADKYGETALHKTLRDHTYNPALAQDLLAAGASVHARTTSGSTPLHYAAMLADSRMVGALLRAGADAATPNAHGSTALHRAAYAQSADTVGVLVGSGADPNARDRFDETPLHKAGAWNRDPAVAVALIGAGADLNAQDRSGATALHHAAYWNENPAVVLALIEAGAAADIRDGLGDTALDFALRRYAPFPESVAALRSAASGVRETRR